VDDGCWLVLNAGEHYALEIDSLTEVRSTVVFFPDGWAERVARIYRERPELLLDDPTAAGRPVRFIEATVPADTAVSPRLLELDHAGRDQEVEEDWLEENCRTSWRICSSASRTIAVGPGGCRPRARPPGRSFIAASAADGIS